MDGVESEVARGEARGPRALVGEEDDEEARRERGDGREEAEGPGRRDGRERRMWGPAGR